MIEIRQAGPDDRDRVVATVVAAFPDDPVFRYLFPGASYPEQAAAFGAYLFDKRVGAGTVWIADGGAAVAMWDAPSPPDGPPIADVLPADAVARLESLDTVVHRHMPTTPHWYLGVLARDPAHAGRRLGRAVMEPGLRAAARDAVPAYLETATPVNVALYERSGWAVAHRFTVSGVETWILRHPGLPAT